MSKKRVKKEKLITNEELHEKETKEKLEFIKKDEESINNEEIVINKNNKILEDDEDDDD